MSDVFQMVTDRILDMLSTNLIPWRCPWTRTGSGCISYSTGRPYSLLNQLLLGAQPGEYITFNQAKAAGGSVRKGEKSRFVVFWKLLEEKDRDTGEITTIPILKYYNVFRVDQCDHIAPRWAVSVQSQPGSSLVPDEQGERVICDYVDRSGVTYIPRRSDKACYTPATDTIIVPELTQYTEVSEFYSSAFHEIIHSTGAKHRLNRLGDSYNHEAYSKEELVAEIGSAFLCRHCGIETDSSLQNSSSYIRGWSIALKSDKRMIVWAAGKAEKAANYVLGIDTKEANEDGTEF